MSSLSVDTLGRCMFCLYFQLTKCVSLFAEKSGTENKNSTHTGNDWIKYEVPAYLQGEWAGRGGSVVTWQILNFPSLIGWLGHSPAGPQQTWRCLQEPSDVMINSSGGRVITALLHRPGLYGTVNRRKPPLGERWERKKQRKDSQAVRNNVFWWKKIGLCGPNPKHHVWRKLDMMLRNVCPSGGFSHLPTGCLEFS